MKPNSSMLSRWLAVIWLGLWGAAFAAPAASPIDRVTKKGDKVMAVRDGRSEELLENITFPGDIKVSTNGTFQVSQGKERTLKEGEILDKEGTLTSPDGTVQPVVNHLAMKNGRIVVVKDG